MSKVAVVGLGYVGLPLAVAFGRHFETVGFDVDAQRVQQCRDGVDTTGEVDSEAFTQAQYLEFTSEPAGIAEAGFIVITVPTPVDEAQRPDFSPLISACETVGPVMARGAVVIFESTVYPGATEEVCVPVLERASGLTWMKGFHVAYSPERVNPGDREHSLQKIVKLVSADDADTLAAVADIYRKIIDAGVYEVDSIQIAEAAKVIENTQRDLNIALVNELAIIFDRLGLDTAKVLQAAGTKWNFLPFRPGLVGGHCIGVDPYYLTYKAQCIGYHPEIILAGRRINDGMGKFIAEQTVKTMLKAGLEVRDAKVNVFGVTFKENCPDLRNSQVFNVLAELRTYGIDPVVHDPVADPAHAEREYGVELKDWEAMPVADVLVLAVAHTAFTQRRVDGLLSKVKNPGVVIDVKSVLDTADLKDRGLAVWRL
jgi:UDP-N-acetyl-D-galactosamine dehydrogenase